MSAVKREIRKQVVDPKTGKVREVVTVVWRARYRDASGKEHARHFAKKIDADTWVTRQTAAVLTGEHVDPRAGRVTVMTYATRWESAQVGREATARITDNALRLHLYPRLGDRRMDSVRRSDIQGFVKVLSDKLAAGTVRNIYDVTARLFSSAVDDKVISSSPCRRIVLPKVDDAEVQPPTVEDVLRLANAVPARYRALVVFLAGSGLRIGEALGLEVSDIDFLRRTVRVERQRLQDGRLAPPKTPKSVRTVPLAQVVVDELAAHVADVGNTGALFTAEDGSPLLYWRWKAVWGNALKKASLDFTTHDLRHLTASALISGGASVKQVQTVLGHSSAVITLRTYAHMWPGDDDRARSVIDAALGVLRTGCGLEDLESDSAAGQEA
jgi:integrase